MTIYANDLGDKFSPLRSITTTRDDICRNRSSALTHSECSAKTGMRMVTSGMGTPTVSTEMLPRAETESGRCVHVACLEAAPRKQWCGREIDAREKTTQTSLINEFIPILSNQFSVSLKHPLEL